MDRRGPEDEFERIVLEAVETLPAWVREAAEGTLEIRMAREPDPADFPEHVRGHLVVSGGPMEVFGLYTGLPLPLRRLSPFAWPPSVIHLYYAPCLRRNPDVPALRFQVRCLVEHEVGHHFGLTEEQIAKAHRRTPEA